MRRRPSQWFWFFARLTRTHGYITEVVDHGFKAAIVKQIGDCKATAGARISKTWAGYLADIAKLAVAEVVVEEAGFAVEGA